MDTVGQIVLDLMGLGVAVALFGLAWMFYKASK